MNKLMFCFLPAVLFLSNLHPVINSNFNHHSYGTIDSSKNIMDSNDIRIFLESKKTILYTVGNMVYAADKQDPNKKYIDGYEILGSSKVNYKKMLSLKMCLLSHDNYRSDVSRCSFFPKYCLSFVTKAGKLNFFLPDTTSCDVITILKINSIDNKETEFSFSKEILDKIKTSSTTDK